MPPTLHASYSPALVVTSFLIAGLASYAALDLVGRVAAARGPGRAAWLAAGALAMGVGIWGMHFVGMLAFGLTRGDGTPVPIAYDVGGVVLSTVVAVAASALALSVAARAELGRWALTGAALVMGVAIAGMHYVGMTAMRLPDALGQRAGIVYRPALVGLAYAIAAAASLAALWLSRRSYRAPGSFFVRLAAPAVVMGVAIAGMHYTGMASAQFHPALPVDSGVIGALPDDPVLTAVPAGVTGAGLVLATPALAGGTTAAIFLVLALTLASTMLGRRTFALAGSAVDRRGVGSGAGPGVGPGARPVPSVSPPAPPVDGDDPQPPDRPGRLNPWRARQRWRRDADALDSSGPSLRTKIATASVAAGLILVVALLAYWGFYQFQESARWVAHTNQVRATVQRADAAVSEAEAAGRAYLVNGAPRYADAYRAGIARARQHLTTAERLTIDNPSQQARLARLGPLLGRRFTALDTLVALRRARGAAAVIAAVAAQTAAPGGSVSAVLADSVHQLVAQVDSVEGRLLVLRNRHLAGRSRLVTLTLLVGSLVAFTLVLLVLQAIRRDVALREAAQARVREQAEALAIQAEQLEQQQVELEQQVEEQQVLNEELAEANLRLEGATRRRERLIQQLERSNKDLDQFAYVASHDLKAPLRGIANLSSWIEEDLAAVMTEDAREQMNLLRGRVHRMEALIDGILLYSRAGRVRAAPEPVDTGALVREAVELLAPPAGTRVEIADGMPTVLAERVPLQQVFMNLIGNAVKYGRTGGDALVRVTWADEPTDPDAPRLYRFSVADNGPGIAPQYHERVFGIFQTLQSRDQVEGTGIGLSVVKKIVEGKGGRVWVESAEGEGATFHFTWPAAPAPNPGEA